MRIHSRDWDLVLTEADPIEARAKAVAAGMEAGFDVATTGDRVVLSGTEDEPDHALEQVLHVLLALNYYTEEALHDLVARTADSAAGRAPVR